MSKKESGMTYKAAGVDIEKADKLVKSIGSIAKSTHRGGVLNSIGGFGALFEVPVDRYQQPVLVSGTDGVGTKLKLAIDMKQHDSIGIDLVAMCVNDILTLGAEPLFFLDYFATGKLSPTQGKAILSGIGKGCKLAKAALIGGETAEMPGLYQNDDYDLAGFCVGIVEKHRIIDGSGITAGDQLVALASSGTHANGYSLIRRVIDQGGHSLAQPFENSTLGEVLLTPTAIYSDIVMQLMQHIKIQGMVHVTGGGLLENIPRILPETVSAVINRSSWQQPAIFDWLQQQGQIDNHEMLRTFNLGVGMVIIVKSDELESTLNHCQQLKQDAWHLGEIRLRNNNQVIIK